jgi:hypothetical protein
MYFIFNPKKSRFQAINQIWVLERQLKQDIIWLIGIKIDENKETKKYLIKKYKKYKRE